MVLLGGWAFSYERTTPVHRKHRAGVSTKSLDNQERGRLFPLSLLTIKEERAGVSRLPATYQRGAPVMTRRTPPCLHSPPSPNHPAGFAPRAPRTSPWKCWCVVRDGDLLRLPRSSKTDPPPEDQHRASLIRNAPPHPRTTTGLQA